MLKCTVNLAPQLIRTKNFNFESEELTVVDYVFTTVYHNHK